MPMTSVNIRDEIWREIKVLAIDRKTNMAAIINEALEQYLQKKSITAPKKGNK